MSIEVLEAGRVNYFDDPDYMVAIVGAGRGIGKAAALHMAGHGVRVACLDRDGESAEATAAEIGGRAMARPLEVAEEASIPPAIDAVARAFGRIDAPARRVPALQGSAAAHAGAQIRPRPARGLDRRQGRQCRHDGLFRDQGRVDRHVKSLAKDYVEHGITINALAPAVIRTPMVEALPQATIDYMTAKIPMRRCGELDEAAQMIAWIVSPACSFTSGFTFDLSGGRATY